jgi:hypothetical protein
MVEPSLRQLEGEVEAARGKLASDLATLRSPATTAEFTETLKQEAMDAKDALVDKAKSTVQSSIESLVEDLKARAAANPAAALAIGAGIAWRLIRHPPISTALVGAGLLALFRTPPARTNGRAPADYLSHARTRLMEQAGAAADVVQEKSSALAQSAKETIAQSAEAVNEKLTQSAQAMSEKVEALTADATAAARDAAVETREQARAMWRDTTETIQGAVQSAASSAASARSVMAAGVDRSWSSAETLASDSDVRNKLLLGAAGLAVVAALGIALQRRAEDAEAA